jgi:nucleotide-binding universal stress UspA family protein
MEGHKPREMEWLMFNHILIATDGSDVANKAVDQGLALAKALKAKVTVVTVTEPFGSRGEIDMAFSADQYDKQLADWASKMLSPVASAAKEAGISYDIVHMAGSYPAEGIIKTAKEKGCDLIVMASHGRSGLQRLILGSQTQKVVALSTLPVLVWR